MVDIPIEVLHVVAKAIERHGKYEVIQMLNRPLTPARATMSPAQRNRIIDRDGETCRYCDRRVARKSCQIDHVIPVSQGGTNSDDNLALACRRCNTAKAARVGHQCQWCDGLTWDGQTHAAICRRRQPELVDVTTFADGHPWSPLAWRRLAQRLVPTWTDGGTVYIRPEHAERIVWHLQREAA